MAKEYKHIISLGCFCGVALELESLGLRDASYPFDWLISKEYDAISYLIENNFNGFLDYDSLCQYDNYRKHYYNEKLRISFFHDFSEYIPLKDQFDDVKTKYDRRIARFYNAISKPTLFVRYFYEPSEVEFWTENYDKQLKLLKSFCSQNELILIASSSLGVEENEYTFCVENDIDSPVSKEFCSKNKRLNDLLNNKEIYDEQTRCKNLEVYEMKQQKKKKEQTIMNRAKKKIGKLRKMYVHSKLYYE